MLQEEQKEFTQKILNKLKKKSPKLYKTVMLSMLVVGSFIFIWKVILTEEHRNDLLSFKEVAPQFELPMGKFINPSKPFYLRPINKSAHKEEPLTVKIDQDPLVSNLGKPFWNNDSLLFEIDLKKNKNLLFGKIESEEKHLMQVNFPEGLFSDKMELIYSFEKPQSEGEVSVGFSVDGKSLIFNIQSESASFQQHIDNKLEFFVLFVENSDTLYRRTYSDIAATNKPYHSYALNISHSVNIDKRNISRSTIIFGIQDQAGNTDTNAFELKNANGITKRFGVKNLDSLFEGQFFDTKYKTFPFIPYNPFSESKKEFRSDSVRKNKEANQSEIPRQTYGVKPAKILEIDDYSKFGQIQNIASLSTTKFDNGDFLIRITFKPDIELSRLSNITIGYFSAERYNQFRADPGKSPSAKGFEVLQHDIQFTYRTNNHKPKPYGPYQATLYIYGEYYFLNDKGEMVTRNFMERL